MVDITFMVFITLMDDTDVQLLYVDVFVKDLFLFRFAFFTLKEKENLLSQPGCFLSRRVLIHFETLHSQLNE